MPRPLIARRAALAALPALFLIYGGARAQVMKKPLAAGTPALAAFQAFLAGLWPRAKARDISRALFDETLANLRPDPTLLGGGVKQPEFERTIKAYLDGAVSAGRVAGGVAARARWKEEVTRIDRAEGVPAEIILAIWGVESEFGRAALGKYDVLRSVATLSFARGDDDLAEEVVATLEILEKGFAPREKLRGSWAGAMGQPQFLPSAYLKYAVSYRESGPPDIWNSAPDSLASIAHFLRLQGWKSSLGWGVETIVPAAFDWRELTSTFENFSARGFRSADGSALAPSGAATLYLPAGAGGPAFLVSDNYWIIKQYNNSDSYAMAVALLGERIAGRGGVRAVWPADLRLLDAQDRIAMQMMLRERGFYDGKIDGKFGPVGREAIHKFQVSAGIMPADGFASARVLEALRVGR